MINHQTPVTRGFLFIGRWVDLCTMKLLIITLLLPIFISAQSWKDIKKAAGKVNNEIKNATNKVKTFTEEEAASALKQTLNKGVEKGVNILSVSSNIPVS